MVRNDEMWLPAVAEVALVACRVSFAALGLITLFFYLRLRFAYPEIWVYLVQQKPREPFGIAVLRSVGRLNEPQIARMVQETDDNLTLSVWTAGRVLAFVAVFSSALYGLLRFTLWLS